MTTTRNRLRRTAGPVRGFSGGAAVLALAACIMAWSSSVSIPEARAEASVSVLCYHSFLEKKKMDPFSFTVDELNSQILQLKKEGFRFVSINDVIGGRITGTKNVLITVDDGNKSVYDAYRKVFKPNGIRPLLGIYPNIIINKKHYALTWEQLTELANSGCDIAAHGYFHLKINRKLYDKNPGYFKKEIFLVKKVLEEKLNRKITVFVYPFGLRDDLTIKTLREAGYRYAFTINNGRIDIPLGAGDRPFELPRYMVTRTSWKYCFNSVVRNARHKTSCKVAAVGGESMEKPDMTAMGRAPSVRHDPAAELASRLTERIDRVAMADEKTEKNGKQIRESRTKKKIEKKTGIDSDPAAANAEKAVVKEKKPAPEMDRDAAGRDRAKSPDIFPPLSKGKNLASAERNVQKREKYLFPDEERRSSAIRQVLKVESNVKRESPGPARTDMFPGEHRRASMVSIDGLSFDRRGPAEIETGSRRENPAALEAKVSKGANKQLSGMKEQYRGINSRTLRTYRGVLGLVSGKIERIKHAIRKYVLSHF
ncbi:MAG TPA: polysaccharide deacetylase family protein [Spirochaetota bacterium]|nr:polysaccharide deacetylase family protein [Spirochaetota bacterium]HPL17492.1 polysaccharide deacetylase family protein [Spirochaetota bacterium]HQF08171.1 polysaccharide deacetylase family protein [Spirochaetota bacterium]HQH96942.1 polysaccharide deacetylase family protein [Spirochaetota bacterium]HQJ70124.1 polysaccharide deacetylase family protein [Spirochaetota bacterium]